MRGEVDEIIDKFDEAYSNDVVLLGENSNVGLKKFGSSGHICIRSIFSGSCDGYVVIPAEEIATLGQALIKLAKENAQIKAEIARQEKIREQSNGARPSSTK